MKSFLKTLLLLPAIWLVGCGSSRQREQSREGANQAYRAGTAALGKRDYTNAVQQLTAAIEGGWLNIDVNVHAHVKRAIANAALDNYDAAYVDLDAAEQTSPYSDRVYAARSYVLTKQGRKKEAKAAWAKARRINRSVEKFKD